MDVEGYLFEQEGGGEWDSQGFFTLASSKAQETFAKFALENPSLYILKLVQAAVALGASRITVEGIDQGLALWFEASSPEWVDQLEEILSDFTGATDVGSRLLSEGWGVAAYADAAVLELIHWCEDGSGLALIRRNGALLRKPLLPRPSGFSKKGGLWKFSIKKFTFALFSSPIESEMTWLRSRCRYLPLEFWLNGKQEPRRPDSQLEKGLYTEPFWLCERFESVGEPFLRVGVPQQGDRRELKGASLRVSSGQQTFFLEPCLDPSFQEIDCKNAYYLPVTLRGPDVIALVHHGVVVGLIKVRRKGAGALAIVDGSGLRYDLSGFSVVRDEAFLELLRRVDNVWLGMAKRVNPWLSELTGFESPDPLTSCSQWFACGCLGLVWPVFLEPTIALFIGGSSLLAYGAHRVRSAKENLSSELQALVKERLDYLLEPGRWPAGRD